MNEYNNVDMDSLRKLTNKLTSNGYLVDRAAQWEYALDAVQDLVMIVNPSLKIKFVNKAFWERLKLLKADFLDKSCFEILHCPNCKRAPGDCLIKYDTEPDIISYDDVFIKDLGGWFNFSHSPIHDEDEHLLGFICMLHDVTDRKEAESALKNSEEKYRHLIKYAPSGIYEIDFVGNKFISVNDVMCFKSGYTEEEFLNKIAPTDILSPKSLKSYKNRLDRIFKGASVPNTFEVEVMRKDGTYFWANLNINFQYTEDRITGASVISHDIDQRKRMELALEESEKKYRNLFNSIKDSILVVDVERNIIDFNKSFSSKFGYSLDELKGKKTLHIHKNKDTYEAFGKVLKENFGNSGFLRTTNYKKKNNEIFPGETGTYYLKNDDGKTTGYIGVIRDVTARRVIEDALRKSEEKYRSLHDTMPLAAMVYGPDGKVLEWNQGAEKIFGWTKEDIIRKDFFDFIILDEDKEELGKLAHKLKIGDLSVINHINQNKTKDGNVIVCEWFNSVYRDCKGKPIGIISLAMDVTSKQLIENKLRENEAIMKSIFRAAPAGIGLINTSQKINWTNFKLREMTGYSEEELADQDMRMLYPDDNEYRFVMEAKYNQLKKEGVGNIETVWKRKDGRLIRILLSSSPIDPGDWAKGITFTALDITNLN